MIDDFQVLDDPGYAYDDYGPGKALTPDLVDPACRRLRNLGIKGSMGGVFIIFRPTAPHMMTTVLKTPSCSRFCFLTAGLSWNIHSPKAWAQWRYRLGARR